MLHVEHSDGRLGQQETAMDVLPEHDFGAYSECCRYCGVPRYFVVDGYITWRCGAHPSLRTMPDAT